MALHPIYGLLIGASLLAGCVGDKAETVWGRPSLGGGGDTAPDLPCDADMALVEVDPEHPVCMDRYEAPNVAGALPLVMYTLVEAKSWCFDRGKRLCTDVEWEGACAGSEGWDWPYGEDHVAGTCNDDKVWITYDQSRLNGWPVVASSSGIESLDALLAAAAAESSAGADAAAHIEELYQGEGSGSKTACTNETGVYDLSGNVEEWTLRDDGGETDFHGNLKGRYWAEARPCSGNVTTHGDSFRFYEIGFRCCQDP